MHGYGGMLRAWVVLGLPLQLVAVWGCVRHEQWRTDGSGWWRRDVRSRSVWWRSRVRRRRRRRRRTQLGRRQIRGLARRDPVPRARRRGGKRLCRSWEACGWPRYASRRAPRALGAMRGEGAMGAPGPMPSLPAVGRCQLLGGHNGRSWMRPPRSRRTLRRAACLGSRRASRPPCRLVRRLALWLALLLARWWACRLARWLAR